MELVLKQLGELLLGSIPTVILMLLLYGVYTLVLHRPLQRVLAERRSKTEGAIEKARAAIGAAEARAAEYDQRLREARLLIYQQQQTNRAQLQQIRAKHLADARASAQTLVEQARADIERDKVAAQSVLQQEATKLAAEVIRTVLRPVLAQAPMGGQ